MSFYYSDEIYNEESAREVVPWLNQWFIPKSVVDVGCGRGEWLKVFMDNGITDIHGIDKGSAQSKQLKIPGDKYVNHDLCLAFSTNRTYDLALCLEVAEHLPESAANQLVSTLTSLSETVVFSAAIPGQGGQGHLNEQLPGYWQSLFQDHDFEFYDVMRPVFWNNENVKWYYRQNMFVVSKNKMPIIPLDDPLIKTYIHPGHYGQLQQRISYMEKNPGIRNSFKLLMAAIRNRIGRR